MHLTALRVLLAIPTLLIGACERKPHRVAPEHAIGDQLVSLEYRLGSIWGGGYSVRVFPQEYLILENKNCADAKRQIGKTLDPNADGLCVLRLDKGLSDRFEAAMQPFKRYAVPMTSFSIEEGSQRPDGQRCKTRFTDHDQISLVWMRTTGAQIAAFDTGCDAEEYSKLYSSLRQVIDPLPIGTIIGKR